MSTSRLICSNIVRLSARRYRGQRRMLMGSSFSQAKRRESSVGGAGQETFGFQQVHPGAKKGKVADVFSSVAQSYDVMNDLMSAGVHRFWKDQFVNMLGISSGYEAGSPPPNVLDVAGGTGDIAFRIADQLQPYVSDGISATDAEGVGEDGNPGAGGHHPLLTVSDINPDMLQVGKQRAEDKFPTQMLDAMRFAVADAEALPFPDCSFDTYTIAFGLRNVTDIDKALREAHRVLKPGGRFMCLEFSHVVIEPLGHLYDWYSFNVIPRIGEVVASDREAYQYLVESIRMFPRQVELQGRIRAAGFKLVSYRNLTAGVVAIHSGFKLPSKARE